MRLRVARKVMRNFNSAARTHRATTDYAAFRRLRRWAKTHLWRAR